ncbi:putative short-chain dehydrogenase [Rhizodiscina lignyota]|uniref:Short-chain dehydrogenase n=1 Tax=Rhizodiscina lignyota TaxID=1504668 RepID=A0A9P4M1B1_9PEZI|nr:putative short-chain dehydrogenase [Rhizodiscina lignyota]
MASLARDINTTIQDVMSHFKGNAEDKTYVITGPSVKSLGAGVARGLAIGNPKRLILIGRSKERIQPVIDEINKLNPAVSTYFIAVNLLDLSTVRKGAEDIKNITPEVHGLVNCAGIMAPSKYEKSADGIESQFASNHVAHFLLTNLLIAELAKGNGVVVNVSSTGYELGEVDFEDPNFQNGETYDSWAGYGQSKTANILFTVALAKRASKLDVVAFAVDPGLVVETALQANSGVTQDHFMKGYELQVKRSGGIPPPMPPVVSLEQGVAVIVWPLLDPDLRKSSGSWIQECRISSAKPYATDADDAEKLWRLSEKLVGRGFNL